jgi:hypothetical protein
MKTKIIAIVLGVVLTGGVAIWLLFKGSDKHLQLIPSDAAIVVSADWKSLAKKVEFEKIKQLQFYKELELRMKESKDESARQMSEIMENPLSSGINFMSQTYLSVVAEDDAVIASIVFDIRDEGDFETMLRKMDSTSKIIKARSFQYTNLDGALLAWSSKGGILAFENGLNRNEFELYLDKIFNQPKASSMADNEHFHKMMKKSKDLSLFMNGEGYKKLALSSGGMAQLDEDLAYLTKLYWFTTLEFKEDDISLISFQESDDPAYKELISSSGKVLSDPILQLITPEKIYGFIAGSLDIPKVYEFFRNTPIVRKNLNDLLAELQWTEDDLKNAFAGDFSIALTDVKIDNPGPFTREMAPWMSDEDFALYGSMYAPTPSPYPVFTAQFTTTTKDKWRGLMNLRGRDLGFEPTAAGDWVHRSNRSSEHDVWCVETPVGYTITNDSAFAQSAKTGGNPASLAVIKPYVTADPISGYMNIDITTYPQPLQAELLRNEYSELLYTYITVLKDVKMNGGMGESSMTLALKPVEGNSLFQLIAQGDLVYLKSKEIENRMSDEYRMDTMPSIEDVDPVTEQAIEVMP